MANYNIAYNKVIKIEGGYVNDPDDAGGETYIGISRKFNPNAKFWKVIDEIKSKNKSITNKEMNAILKKNNTIIGEIKNIYKNKYWDKLYLDNLNSQKIAEELFDTAVNMGVSVAIKILQNSLRVKTDGKMTNDLIKIVNERKFI
jgi:lysozyme family protein